MTEVLVRRAPDGTITELQVKGHTGYAEQGEDIVCAGVTVLAVTALMHCKLKPGGTPESAAKAQVILETTVLGLLDIEKDYPKYVRVTEGG